MFALAVILSACSSDDKVEVNPAPSTLKINFKGLENLGSDFKYEGWVMVDGKPISTGVFSVDDAGNLSKSSFDLAPEILSKASKFILSIEPAKDTDPAPSNTKLLVGDFAGSSAKVDASIVGDFSKSKGKYLVGTPTNGNLTPQAGVWFLDASSGSPMAGLSLPKLDEGWIYEGWVVSNGVPVSTGKFKDPNGPDDAAPFSGSLSAPPFPGEDFLVNAPAGVTFPGNMSGATFVISVEPVPDNSPMPFALKPLLHTAANPVVTGITTDMKTDLSGFPTGTITK